MAGGEALEGRAMSNHYCLGRIDFGVGSSAFWCLDTPGTLVVFLHGFTGAAEATWHNASAYIRRDALFSSADVLFLGYDSVRSRARVISRWVLDLFRKLLAEPAEFSNRYIYYGAQRQPFIYDRVVVVAHSLGGAIMRQVALDLARANDAYADHIQLLLFAPAHKGSNALHNAGGMMVGHGILAALRCGLLYKAPILEDLRPKSDFIRDIEAGTLTRLARGRLRCLVATKITIGQYENIVEPGDFAQDPPFYTVDRRNHTDVCKSDAGYRRVLDDIEECLR
jgi:pimeloyl-ACP methyl ester carboxylesterase